MDAETLISNFFSSPNRMTLDRFLARRERWISALRMEDERCTLSFLLHNSADGNVVWYAVGTPSMPAGELLELCRSFVGPSYAVHIEVLGPARATSPHEHALVAYAAAFLGAIVRVSLGVLTEDRRTDAEHTAAAFELMERLIENRPPWSGFGTRSLSQVLADLDLALADADEEGAERLLMEVERSHSISEVNLQFLRIRILQAVGRGAEILTDERLSYLVHAQRPRKVTQALLEAAHDAHLADVPMDPAALAAAGENILAILGPAATELVAPATTKEAVALLAAGLASRRSTQALAHVLNWLEAHGEPGVSAALFAPVSPASVAEAADEGSTGSAEVKSVAELLVDGRPVEALMLLRNQSPSVMTARLAFSVDSLLGSSESAECLLALALPVLEELNEVADGKVLERLDDLTAGFPGLDVAAAVESSTPIVIPTNWQQWLEHLESTDSTRSARELAERGATSWIADGASADAIAAGVGRLDASRVGSVRTLAGIIVDAHGDVSDTEAQLRLKAALLEMIALTGPPTAQELRTTTGWVEEILGSAAAEETVARTLEALEVFIGHHPTPVLAEALADLATIVAYHETASKWRMEFVTKVVAAIRSAGAGADLAVRMAVARAAGDVGVSLHEDEGFWAQTEGGGSWLAMLDGLHIGIHTLMESVASRVRAELEQHVGSGSVKTNNDHVATDALRKLATGSDVFVLVTGAAKHAASEEVKRYCPDSRLVQITSKGFSGLLRGLESFVRAQRAVPSAA